MNSLNTLYFPDTLIQTSRQYPLFLLFKPLNLLLPVEQDTTSEQKPADIFTENDFCQVHTPLPLGEEKDRFLHLIRDITTRKDDYAAQLSALSLAAMSETSSRGDESRQSIISSLVGSKSSSATAREEEQKDTLLWQARLVLKIGEVLDREEEDVAFQLSLLDEDEMGMFQELQGQLTDEGQDNPFAELEQIKQRITQPRPHLIKNRFTAWLQLFQAAELPSWALWTTSRQEAADLVLDRYEERYGSDAIPFEQIQLPATLGSHDERRQEMVTAFTDEAAKLLADLSHSLGTLLQQTGHSRESLSDWKPQTPNWITLWADLLEDHFPEAEFGRSHVTLYMLPQTTFGQLFSKEKSPATADNCILAVLK